MDGSEQREFSRLPLHVTAEFAIPNGKTIASSVDDMSLNGFRTRGPIPMNVGDECRAELKIGKEAQDFCIHVQVRVARQADEGTGFRILAIEGGADLAHLRNLLLYNADDAGQLEAEFGSHSGLNRRSDAE
jgi:hypothetical protein